MLDLLLARIGWDRQLEDGGAIAVVRPGKREVVGQAQFMTAGNFDVLGLGGILGTHDKNCVEQHDPDDQANTTGSCRSHNAGEEKFRTHFKDANERYSLGRALQNKGATSYLNGIQDKRLSIFLDNFFPKIALSPLKDDRANHPFTLLSCASDGLPHNHDFYAPRLPYFLSRDHVRYASSGLFRCILDQDQLGGRNALRLHVFYSHVRHHGGFPSLLFTP